MCAAIDAYWRACNYLALGMIYLQGNPLLKEPKGWGAPAEVDGHRIEAFWRSHQVPLADVKTNPQPLQILENWMHSLKPEQLFDESGRLRAELAAIAPAGTRHMSASPQCKRGTQEKAAPARFSRPRNQNRAAGIY